MVVSAAKNTQHLAQRLWVSGHVAVAQTSWFTYFISDMIQIALTHLLTIVSLDLCIITLLKDNCLH